jgi:hypothetical protein
MTLSHRTTEKRRMAKARTQMAARRAARPARQPGVCAAGASARAATRGLERKSEKSVTNMLGCREGAGRGW